MTADYQGLPDWIKKAAHEIWRNMTMAGSKEQMIAMVAEVIARNVQPSPDGRLELAKRCRIEAENWKGNRMEVALLKIADELQGDAQEFEDRPPVSPPEPKAEWCCKGDGENGHESTCRYSQPNYQAPPPARPVQQPAPNKFASGREPVESEQNKTARASETGFEYSSPSLRNEPLAISVQQPATEPTKEDCHMLDAIMKAAKQIHKEFDCLSDHVKTKKQIREQIAAIIWKHIDSRAALALRDVPQGPDDREIVAEWRSCLCAAWANGHRAVMTMLLEIGPSYPARSVPVGPEGKK